MGIFDDIADGFEKVADTVADAVTSPLDTLSDLADHGLGVICDMRGAAALLPVGFPALALMGELDEVTNSPIMEAFVDTIGNAPQQSMGGLPDPGRMLGDVTEAPTGFAGFGSLGRMLGRRSGAEQVALNPQPLPSSPVGLRNIFDAINRGAGERALNPQPLPPSPKDRFGALDRGAEQVSLNPQPLPPAPEELARVFDSAKRGPEVFLNPQPLPPAPKELARVIDSAKRGPEVFLNPQPLPPAPEDMFAARRFDAVALNPQPLPPAPLKQLLDVNQLKLPQLSKASLAKSRMF